jgi:hypothetical protein
MKERPNSIPTLTVLAYGGGTNSKALAIECVKRGIPLDAILFADTGGELPETYEDIRRTSTWLRNHGYPAIGWVHYTRRNGERLTLEQDCLDKKMLPSIAYGFKSCSLKFKVDPQDKFMNNWEPAREVWKAGGQVTKLIGYDAGEPHRVKDYQDKKYAFRYPLVEWGMDREDCVEVIKAAGLPLPGKSACFFCPSSKAGEIKRLKRTHPEYLARALAMEANAKENLTSVKGLGRRWSWTDLVDADDRQADLFLTPPEIPCGCYDGGSN